MEQRQHRIHAFDAVRAAAMSCGIILHSAVAYMQDPMPGLLWAVRDAPWGWNLDGLFWYLHGFRIPLFFVTAGFFAALIGHRRGAGPFIRRRLARLAVPLVLASVTILPLVYLIWGLGLTLEGTATWEEFIRGQFQDPRIRTQIWGLGHLWFLQYLLIYSLVFAGCLWRFPGCIERGPARLKPWFLPLWRPLPWAALTMPFLLFQPEIMIRFDNGFVPDPARLAFYAVFFIAGLGLYWFSSHLHRLKRASGSLLLLSVLLFISVVVPLLRTHAADAAPTSLQTVSLAISLSLFCWLSIFSWLGVALRLVTGHRAVIRYLSDASYWIYLIHLPLVALAQVSLAQVDGTALHSGLKFTLVVALALAGTLSSYHLLVRRTLVGRMLNGRRPPLRDPSAVPTAEDPSRGRHRRESC